ncbi:MAG: hypothetical protein WAV11_01220 [Minisyncoccia bacterium]
MSTYTKNKMIQPNKIIIWGLRKKYHTHRHIHKAFYENANKLGYKVLWLEDEKENAKYIEPNDLIISAEVIGKMVPEKLKLEDYNLPIRGDVYYCLHNYKNIFLDKLNPAKLVRLQVYSNKVESVSDQKWGSATYFDSKTRTLYQPWGTDLLPSDFKKPVFNRNHFVFWIGSIWNNAGNQGNLNAIDELKVVLKQNKLKFVNLRFIPDWLNIFLIRKSRIAPAIVGKYQEDIDYLPCRMFKNISYGQLGITNVRKFKDILGNSFIEGNSIKEITEKALSLSKDEYVSKVKAQQEIVRNYTYKNSIENIIRTFDN